MSQKATHDDVSALSLEGTAYLADAMDARLSFNHEFQDGTSLGDINTENTAVKKSATLALNLTSATGNQKVSALAASAISLDSVNILAEVEGMTVNIRNQYSRCDGVNDAWAKHVFVLQDVTGSVRMMVPLDFATNDALVLDAANSTLSNLEMTWAFTVNSVGFSIPMILSNLTHEFVRGDKQMVSMDLVGFGEPTLPSGTSSLLEQALNLPGTSQTLALTSKAAGGLTYAGEFLPESLSFNVNRGELVVTAYNYISDGTITATPTTA